MRHFRGNHRRYFYRRSALARGLPLVWLLLALQWSAPLSIADNAFIYRICGFSQLILDKDSDPGSTTFCSACVVQCEAGHGFVFQPDQPVQSVLSDEQSVTPISVQISQYSHSYRWARAPPELRV
ncbi:hypothetical protein [Gynuella sunshinyii]|uniref:hypothetical protein n=1 Tax=Gynuella sunshinyii TaxID=1445505 RepID=UPI0005CC3EA8|nr:hypothetical protein [Gynuella sunshinyii]